MALRSALPEHGTLSRDRFLRTGPGLRPRGTRPVQVRPLTPPPGEVRPGEAGGRAFVGVAVVAADAGSVSTPVDAAGPAARRDVPGDDGVAAHARFGEADAIHHRGLALGGRLHAGIPGAVSR